MNSYIICLGNSRFDPENRLIQKISFRRQETLKHYRFDIDKKLSLYSELAVRMALAIFLHCSPKEFNFELCKNGKPYVSNVSNIFFNISHTRNAILCSVSDTAKIGVDIEKIDNHVPKQMDKICHIEELQYLNSLSISDRKIEYCKIWTRKEAFVKRDGGGIGQNLTKINTFVPEKNGKYFTWQESSYICSIYCDINEKNTKTMITEQNIDEYFAAY